MKPCLIKPCLLFILCFFALAVQAKAQAPDPERICEAAANEYLAGYIKDSDRACHACLFAWKKQKSKRAAWALYTLYTKRNDTETADYWLIAAGTYPKAAKVRAERFLARNMIPDAALWLARANEAKEGVKLCLKTGTPIPNEVLTRFDAVTDAEAEYLRGRLALLNKEKESAQKHFIASERQGEARAKAFREWLNGQVPTAFHDDVLFAVANDPATRKNKALQDACVAYAMKEAVPSVLVLFPEAIEAMPPDEKEKAYALLVRYPEYARKYAVVVKAKGNEKKAEALLLQAAFFGDPQAVFFRAMKEEPADAAGIRKKAKIVSEIFFDSRTPEAQKKLCASWLALFFLNSDVTDVNVSLACDMARAADLQGENALAFADKLLLLGAVATAKEWLLKAEKDSNPATVYAVSLRWKSLHDTEGQERALLMASEAGHTRALVERGLLDIREGQYEKGALRISAAADKSDPEALYHRALLALDGKIQRDGAKILEDLLLALAGGVGEAGVYLSKMAAEGEYMAKSPEESARFAHMAAKAGSREGMRIFGIYSIKGYGVTRNRENARQWLVLASKMGNFALCLS